MEIFNRKLILASKSPRRSELLKAAGFHFRLRTKEVEETYPADMPVEEVAAYLAQKKAEACAEFLTKDDEILIASDCLVILEGRIYGKAADHADAVRILNELSGKTHTVMTGVCLISKKKKRVFSDVSLVHFEPLTEEEIEFYIKNYQPFDKAGAYAIQEWIGLCKISKIEGTYSNIMGLPMEALYRELMNF